ncbi:hypothetical protein WJX73_002086 [Symbiochloris irregularis]|uniref:FAD-binding domain-containing protein n=1 Tax=Symbiochloris irregularis TaxID=706552 RepID=A0AAW1PUR7_9CHLO
MACILTGSGTALVDQERRDTHNHSSSTTHAGRCSLYPRQASDRSAAARCISQRNGPLQRIDVRSARHVANAQLPVEQLTTSSAVLAEVDRSSAVKCVVIGAGPAGSTAAMYLARAGFSVDVFEKRPEPRHDQVDKKRSYIIVLAPRGIHALQHIGIDLPFGENQYLGTVTHPFKGKDRVSPISESSVCWDRVELAQFLIDKAREMFPNRIRYHFSSACEDLDLQSRTITLATRTGSSRNVQYDLLLAADGANSTLRSLLSSKAPGFSFKVQDSGRQYKTFRDVRAPDLEPPQYATRDGRTIHLWLGNNTLTSVSCHRNPDKTYSGTVSLKTGDFDTLSTAKDYEDLIRTQVRGVPEAWAPEIARQCLYAPAADSGKRVQCSALHEDSGIILLGDAAHAVTPVGGQGCNSALEDCEVLEQVLAQSKGDVDQITSGWTARRHADAIAVTHIEAAFYSLIGSGPMRFLNPKFLRIAAHLILGTLRNKLMPWWFGPPALMGLGARTPYSKIQREIDSDATWLAAFLVGLTMFAVAKFLGVSFPKFPR